MFNGLKYVKLGLVILVYVLAFPFGYHKNIDVIDGYTNKLTVLKGDSITVYMDCKEKNRRGQFILYDILGNAIDSIITTCDTKKHSDNNAFDYKPTFCYYTGKLKSGVYAWNKSAPFIVSDVQPCDITIVFPSLNNIANNELNKNNSLQTINIQSAADNIDSYFINFLNWFKNNEKQHTVNFISDADLEDYSKFKNTKVLIFASNYLFWTKPMKQNFDKYIQSGKNALIISSTFMVNEFSFNIKQWQITLERTQERASSPINTFNSKTNKNYNSVGCSYENHISKLPIYNNNHFMTIQNNKHKIFTGLSQKKYIIIAYSGSCPPLKSIDEMGIPLYDFALLQQGILTCLAFGYRSIYEQQSIWGIYEFKQSTSSGKIINIGLADWFNNINLKKKYVSDITKNCIEYLNEN